MVVGLACSNDLKSYASGSIATGRVSQAGQVVRFQTKRDNPGPPGWGLGIRFTSQSRENKFVEKTIQLKFQLDGIGKQRLRTIRNGGKLYWKPKSSTDCSAREEVLDEA
jgi:hypothetical protein